MNPQVLSLLEMLQRGKMQNAQPQAMAPQAMPAPAPALVPPMEAPQMPQMQPNATNPTPPPMTPSYMNPTPSPKAKGGFMGLDKEGLMGAGIGMLKAAQRRPAGQPGGGWGDALEGVAGAYAGQKGRQEQAGQSDAQRRAMMAMQAGDMDGALRILGSTKGMEGAALQAQMARQPKSPEPYTLAPGAQRFGSDGKMIAQNPLSDKPADKPNFQFREINGRQIAVNPENPGDKTQWVDIGPAPPKQSGVTINMPGNIREGIDAQGNKVFVGIDPKDPQGGFQTIAGARPETQAMGAETKGKFAAMAPNAYAGISTLEGLFSEGGDDPLKGADDVTAQIFSGIPGIGPVAARGIGGQNWQSFDQAWNAIELGVHIPAGAAVTPSEAARFLKANKPALNESQTTKLAKLKNVRRFYDGMQAAFNGDVGSFEALIRSGDPNKPGKASTALPTDLDSEEQAMVQQLLAAGKTEAEIAAIINGN